MLEVIDLGLLPFRLVWSCPERIRRLIGDAAHDPGWLPGYNG